MQGHGSPAPAAALGQFVWLCEPYGYAKFPTASIAGMFKNKLLMRWALFQFGRLVEASYSSSDAHVGRWLLVVGRLKLAALLATLANTVIATLTG